MSMRDFWDAYKVGYSTTNDAFDRRREQERYEQQQLAAQQNAAAQRQAELDRILQQQQFQREMQQMKDKSAMDRALLSSPGGGAGSTNRAPAQPWNWDSPPPSNAAPEQVKQAADNFAARNKYLEQQQQYDQTVAPIRDSFATGLSEFNALQEEMRRNQEKMAAGDRKEGGILWGAIGGKRRDELLKEQKQAAFAKLQEMEKVDMTILPPRMRQDYADALIALGPDLPEYLQRIGRSPDSWPQMLLEGVQSGAVRPDQASRMKDILRAAGY
jgi:hypothetical protein